MLVGGWDIRRICWLWQSLIFRIRQLLLSHPGNTWPSIFMKQNYGQSWTHTKKSEPDTQDTAGEARTNSSVIYSYGPPHMAKQKQDDQLEHTYNSYVRIRDATLKTCQKRWMIGRSGERGSGISVLAAWHDDDDEPSKSNSERSDRKLANTLIMRDGNFYAPTIKIFMKEPSPLKMAVLWN